MIEALVFPDTRSAMFDLIHGATHLGEQVNATWQLQADAKGGILGPFPVAHTFAPVGTEGFIDRVERIVVEVYAPGQQAVQTLESIRASIVGTDIETPSGYLDSISCETVPSDIPYQSDTLNRATATFIVISRPIT